MNELTISCSACDKPYNKEDFKSKRSQFCNSEECQSLIRTVGRAKARHEYKVPCMHCGEVWIKENRVTVASIYCNRKACQDEMVAYYKRKGVRLTCKNCGKKKNSKDFYNTRAVYCNDEPCQAIRKAELIKRFGENYQGCSNKIAVINNPVIIGSSNRKCRGCGKDPYPNILNCKECHGKLPNINDKFA